MLNIQQSIGRAINTGLQDYHYLIELGRITLIVLGLAVVGAVLTTTRLGLITVPLAAGVFAAVLLLIIGYQVWWKLLVFILYGYMFASRGFASIGFFPVYIGEVVLALGVLTLFLAPFSGRINLQIRPFLRWHTMVIIAFLAWSVMQTVPYVPTYQFDALRDAMLYGYALYAILIMLFVTPDKIERFFDYFGRFIPLMVMWFPLLFFISRMEDAFPIYFPGSDIPLILSKGSDTAVHLSGIVAYLLLRIDRHIRPWPSALVWFTWVLWLMNFLLYAAFGRAALLSAGVAVAVVLLLRPTSRWDRPLLVVIVALCLMLVTNTYSTLEIDIGLHREVSAEQLVENFTSIFNDSDDSKGGLEGTKQWRIRWWNEIIRYTFNGPYFIAGKGYGVNLANSDGFQVEEDESLRSPHNGHLTFLARSGVVGFALWIIFLLGVAWMLLYTSIKYMHTDPLRSKYTIWMLAYLCAHCVIAGFDVYLEGPMGGIWFWATIGMAFVYCSAPSRPVPVQKRGQSPALVEPSAGGSPT